MFLVLLEVGVLIVVDSSIATIDLGCADKNLYANSAPLPDEKDSTFIIKMFKCVPDLNKVFNNSCCFFDLSDVFQRTIFFSIWSGRCVGISESYQFLYTPLGAINNRPFIKPLSYNTAALSNNTLDLPVPISIKYAKFSLSQDAFNASN